MDALKVLIEYQDVELYYTSPPLPPLKKIEGYGLKNSDQKFKRWEWPKDRDFNLMSSQQQDDIIDYVLEKRINGHFFYNNGEITYITGCHWFYLTFWRLDIGLPQYRRSDRDYFYFWNICEKDERSLGMVDMENRRGGKTERANCISYEYISRNSEKHAGIQSKTDTDAKKVFLKLIRAWKRIPNWLKPVDEGDTQPKSALRFFEAGKRDTKNKQKNYGVALDSWIDFESAKEEAYDGDKLHRYIMDEAGKTVTANVYERWNIVKECFVQGRYIIGKALITTTVEELDKKGGKWFKQIWDESDYFDRDDNDQTRTGLYRFFKPAFYCYEGFIDEHGNPLIEEAREYLERKRKGKTGTSLASEKRKYPFEPDDAFGVINGTFWEEDILDILKQALKNIEINKPNIGYYVSSEPNDEIIFSPIAEREGAIKILEFAQPGGLYGIGIDSIGTDDDTGDGESEIAVVVLKGFFGLEAMSYTPVCTYSFRPNKLESAYEVVYHIVKHYCKFNNVKCIGELNAGGTNLLNFLINRGLERYMQKKPKSLGVESINNVISSKYWIYRDVNVKGFQQLLANRFVRRFGMNIKIKALISSLLDLAKKNADLADAYLMAILIFSDFDRVDKKEKKKAKISTAKWDPATNRFVWTTVEY